MGRLINDISYNNFEYDNLTMVKVILSRLPNRIVGSYDIRLYEVIYSMLTYPNGVLIWGTSNIY